MQNNKNVCSVLTMRRTQQFFLTRVHHEIPLRIFHDVYSGGYHDHNNGPNGHLFYVGGDLMMMRGMLPIIMLPDGDLRIVLHLVPFWILTIWGSVHIEETVVGWRNQLRMKTSAT